MKFNKAVTSSRRKNRKNHFSAPSSVRRVLMSSHLSTELRSKHNIRALPIRKNDEVQIVRGSYKGNEGKVTQVYRRRWVIHVERASREKKNGSFVNIGIKPSNCIITKLHIDKDRQALISRKASAKLSRDSKGKHEGIETVPMAEQD